MRARANPYPTVRYCFVTTPVPRLKTLDKGVHVHMRYYDKVCYVSLMGVISRIDFDLRFMNVNDRKIMFDDILWIEEYEPEGRETWVK